MAFLTYLQTWVRFSHRTAACCSSLFWFMQNPWQHVVCRFWKVAASTWMPQWMNVHCASCHRDFADNAESRPEPVSRRVALAVNPERTTASGLSLHTYLTFFNTLSYRTMKKKFCSALSTQKLTFIHFCSVFSLKCSFLCHVIQKSDNTILNSTLPYIH